MAYLRIMDKNVESEYISIGRVVAAKRRCGYGSKILKLGLRAAEEYFGKGQIYLEAQTYAKTLYEKCGFKQISTEFLLDGIPHIKMLYIKN
ncbi:MAG: GNAT family N-acetyltransferase [Erysipelotrichaceae bacterium]|nr:GNAT family N-acetyltransferase [Erysipelotrichaceae bacterium]